MADPVPFPFATVDDLKDRWPDFPAGGEPTAEKLLVDASELMMSSCPSVGDVSANMRERIACAVVRRAMQADDSQAFGVPGMESWQASAGPMSYGGKFANPHGDIYLTKAEKRSLGCGRQKAFSIDLLAGYDDVLP